MLKRIIYLIILLVIFSCEKNNNSPNIVFILTDDLGYGDLSSYGSETINTINIDRLAEDGVRLTSYYAAQPVCSASRAAILTGVYPVSYTHRRCRRIQRWRWRGGAGR